MKLKNHSYIFISFLLCLLAFNQPAYTQPSKIVSIEHQNTDSYEQLRQNSTQLKALISDLLLAAGYTHQSSELHLEPKQNLVVCLIETNQGAKFLKIHRRGLGISEFLGTCAFQDFASIIPAETLILAPQIEILIQPFIASTYQEGGMLYDKICELDLQSNPETWKLLEKIFQDMLKINQSTLYDAAKGSRNDRLFFERLKTLEQDGISGRIENFYKGKTFKLVDTDLSWEELKHLHWSVDGVYYQETLEELITQARINLDPNYSRLMGISHGDWHEMNIAVKGVNQLEKPFDYAFLDLELAGENDLIADMAIFLTYTTVLGDYLGPKYFPEMYLGKNIVKQAFEISALRKKRQIKIHKDSKQIYLEGVISFGTTEARKKVAQLLVECYYNPLLDHSRKRFGEKTLIYFDNHLKAALLLRLIAVYNITEMDSTDQARVLGLIYQALGTPINSSSTNPVIHHFLDAL